MYSADALGKTDADPVRLRRLMLTRCAADALAKTDADPVMYNADGHKIDWKRTELLQKSMSATGMWRCHSSLIGRNAT